MKVPFIISVMFLFGCKKQIDTQYIQFTLDSLIRSTPNGGILDLQGKSYLVSHTNIIIDKDITIMNGYLKRENQITYIVKQPTTKENFVIVDNTDGLIEGDRFTISTGQRGDQSSPINLMTKISGDTLFTNSSVDGFPAGAKLFKNINFFWVLSSDSYTHQSCTFEHLTLDGNRDNNTGSYYWNLNSAIVAISKGTTTYKYCTFINSPNESLVGHNADVSFCEFQNTNGSGIHTSADKENCAENEIHSLFHDNLFQNTNQILASITGHSEGAITHSDSGGYYTAIHNTFKNVGESVLGSTYSSQQSHDWGDNNILFEYNTIDGAGRMVYNISYLGEKLRNVKIINNDIKNMPYYDYSGSLAYNPSIILIQQ